MNLHHLKDQAENAAEHENGEVKISSENRRKQRLNRLEKQTIPAYRSLEEMFSVLDHELSH